jgi:S1-C subfamily serine protease
MSLIALLWAASAVAQQPASSSADEIITRTGDVYKNVTVQKVAPDGLVVAYTPAAGGIGISKIKFQDLSEELQQRYGYNPTNAATFEKAELESAGRLRTQMLAQDEKARSRRLADDLSAAWAGSSESGTGFFITDDGYLLTCFHVVTNATRIMVGTKQGVLPAELVQSDEVNDVALLKVEGTFAALPLAGNDTTKLGEAVFTVGFPNPGVQGMQPKLTRGEISSLAGVEDDPGEYQISVPVQPGNSGGAVVDEYGNVVGIVAARLSDQAAVATSGMTAQDVNYAVKIARARDLLVTISGLPDKLKPPHPLKDRKFEDVVQEAQNAMVLVMVN